MFRNFLYFREKSIGIARYWGLVGERFISFKGLSQRAAEPGGENRFPPPLWCLNDFSSDLHEILQELRFWSIISIRNFSNLKFFDFGQIFTVLVEFASITDSKLTKTDPKPVQKRSRSHIAAKLVYTRHHPGSKHTGCVLCDC